VARSDRFPREKAEGERKAPEPDRLRSADVIELDRAFAAGTLSPDSLAGGSSRLGALHGQVFSPPVCTSRFTDVPPGDPACPWIEQLARDQITVGCGGGNYCPDSPVTHRQVALLLERSMRGTDTFRPGSTTADIPNRPPAAATSTPLQSAGDVGKYSSITIGADGLGLISVPDSAGVLQVAHCSNVECSEAVVNPVDFASLTYSTSITIGADGFGLISYYDAANGDLKVAHCTNINCSDVNATPLDTESDVGAYTSITIGTDGLGLISYQDNGAHNLKVAHCANTACTTADQITTIDPTLSVGIYTSIAIGADGLGLISYQGSFYPDLRVAHCSNITCTAATITPLDMAGGSQAAWGTSVTIGADGLGLISYSDFDNSDGTYLEVAHSSNGDCTAATSTPI
jgi:hypothetical protein